MFDDRYETISYDPHKCQKSHNVKLYKNYYSADKNSYCVFLVGRWWFFQQFLRLFNIWIWLWSWKTISRYDNKQNMRVKKEADETVGCSCWLMPLKNDWKLMQWHYRKNRPRSVRRWMNIVVLIVVGDVVNCSLALNIFTCQTSRLSTFLYIYLYMLYERKSHVIFFRRKLEAISFRRIAYAFNVCLTLLYVSTPFRAYLSFLFKTNFIYFL